jgi:hypothetical protein
LAAEGNMKNDRPVHPVIGIILAAATALLMITTFLWVYAIVRQFVP